jgi:hypothetical protein
VAFGADDIITWASDNLVNLLIIVGMMLTAAKAVDYRYKQRLDEEVARLEEAHEDDIITLTKQIQDRFEEAFRSINRLDGIITTFFMGGGGPRGPMGARGPMGTQGIVGVTGEQGITGEQGFAGIRGTQGRKGLRGERGHKTKKRTKKVVSK